MFAQHLFHQSLKVLMGNCRKEDLGWKQIALISIVSLWSLLCLPEIYFSDANSHLNVFTMGIVIIFFAVIIALLMELSLWILRESMIPNSSRKAHYMRLMSLMSRIQLLIMMPLGLVVCGWGLIYLNAINGR